MKIIANINKVELRDFEPLISGAYRDKTIDVELSPEYDGLSVWAIFDRQSVKVEGGKCYTPTLERGTCSVGIYAVRLNNEKEIDLRYSPAPALINIEQGSYNSSLNSATAPTESEVEQIYALIDEAINAGMLKGEKGEKGDPGTPGKDGVNGKDGMPGKDGTPGKDGYTPIKGVDYFDGAKGEKGDKGDKGEDYVLTDEDLQKISTLVAVPTKTSELQNDSGYITADDAPPEVYIGSEEPQGNEVIWVDDSTTAENIVATKAYVDEVVNLTNTRIVTDTENTVIPAFELADNTEYRSTLELESIEFTLPENPTDDYISSLVFKSGATATTITYPDTIKWTGDDISSDKFVPASSKTYEVLIYWNGFEYCGIVKGW